MTDGPIYVTTEGLEKLKHELAHRTGEQRRATADKIERAKELGDLSENSEYHEAKDEQAFNEGRILEIEAVVHRAVVAERSADTSAVEIGSRVQVKLNGNEREFCIVGANEADPVRGKISNESPLGKALIGRSVGDAVDVETPNGTKMYRVLGIQ
ncbi:MAG: transcription elongation factor GreA [bacterium]|nr:transcription elongation factor GreA [bacterium]